MGGLIHDEVFGKRGGQHRCQTRCDTLELLPLLPTAARDHCEAEVWPTRP